MCCRRARPYLFQIGLLLVDLQLFVVRFLLCVLAVCGVFGVAVFCLCVCVCFAGVLYITDCVLV